MKLATEIAENLLYGSLDEWRRLSGDRVMRYCGFKIHPNGRYFVWSSGSYHLPLPESDRLDSDRQFLELLIDTAPEIRSETFPTLGEAISSHDRAFSQ